MKREVVIRSVAALAVVGAGASWYGWSRAQSAPPETPVLYTGYLEDAGVPVTGTREIGLSLWSSTDTTTTTNRVCEQAAATTTVTNGWFTTQLGAACLDAVHRHPALFLEFVVDSTAFPLRPIGAVPYAVRAFEYESGSRLKRIFNTAADGSKEVVAGRWWDSLRGEECTFKQTSAAGQAPAGLCLPETGVAGAGDPCYLDAVCTVPATGGTTSSTTPKYLPAFGASSGLAVPGPAMQSYCNMYGYSGCAPGPMVYFPTALLPASDFVSWQEQHD